MQRFNYPKRLGEPQIRPDQSAALRAGWNELDCHGASRLAMTSLSDELSSPAWRARGWPKAGRGLRFMRSEATQTIASKNPHLKPWRRMPFML
jgi:hypothetical protein